MQKGASFGLHTPLWNMHSYFLIVMWSMFIDEEWVTRRLSSPWYWVAGLEFKPNALAQVLDLHLQSMLPLWYLHRKCYPLERVTAFGQFPSVTTYLLRHQNLVGAQWWWVDAWIHPEHFAALVWSRVWHVVWCRQNGADVGCGMKAPHSLQDPSL